MRAFLLAVAVAIVIAVGSVFVLNAFQTPAEMAGHPESVRLPAG
jgi:hypothetical protein